MRKPIISKTVSILLWAAFLVSLCTSAAFADYGIDYIEGSSIDDREVGVLPDTNTGGLYHYAVNCNIPGFVETNGLASEICYENGESGNKVIKTGYNSEGSGSNFSFHSTPLANMYPLQQIWEIRVKVPSVDKGETRLFNYANGTRYFGVPTDRYGFSSVVLKNGGVYLPDDSYTGATYFPKYDYAIVEDNTLQAGEWYRFVRVMDFTEELQNMQRVYVYKENAENPGVFDDLIAASDWRLAGALSRATTPLIRSLGFYVMGYTDSVLFDDFKIYNALSGINTTEVLSDKNPKYKVARMNDMGTALKRIAGKQSYRNGIYHKYEIKIKLPSVGTQSEEIRLFSLGDSSCNWKPQDTYYSVAIKGGAVYSSVYSGSGTAVVETPVSAAAGGNFTMDAGKWYKIMTEGNIETGIFDIYVHDENDTLVGSLEGIEKYPIPHETSSSGKHCFIFLASKGFTKSFFFDDINIYTWSDAEATQLLRSDEFSFEDSDIGDDVLHVLAGTLGITTSTAEKIAFVTYHQDEYPFTGICKTLYPADIKLSFLSKIDESAVNKQNIIFEVNGVASPDEYDVSYNSEDNTAIISFEKLEYDMDYSLTISKDIITKTHGIPLEEEHIYNFKTISDPFNVGEILFKNSSGGIINVTNKLMKNDTIKASAEITNISDEPREYLMILVIYKDGKMLDVTAVSDIIPANTGLTGEDAVTTQLLTVEEDDCDARFMVWDNWSYMRPLTDASAIPSN